MVSNFSVITSPFETCAVLCYFGSALSVWAMAWAPGPGQIVVSSASANWSFFGGLLRQYGKMTGKIRDYFIGFFLFGILFLMAALWVPGKIQTWLLFYSALGRDVAVRHILDGREEGGSESGSDRGNAKLREKIDEQSRLLEALSEKLQSITAASDTSPMREDTEEPYPTTDPAPSSSGSDSIPRQSDTTTFIRQSQSVNDLRLLS